MSVVCARVYGDKVVMAADSIVCRGDMKRTNGNIVKLREVNGMGVGGVGTAKVWTKDCCKLNGAETFKNQTLQPLFRWFSVTFGQGLKG